MKECALFTAVLRLPARKFKKLSLGEGPRVQHVPAHTLIFTVQSGVAMWACNPSTQKADPGVWVRPSWFTYYEPVSEDQEGSRGVVW